MKFAIIALTAFTSSFAVAGALDMIDPYEGRPFASNPDSSCQDGQSQLFVESVNGIDRYVNVIRTCVNGVYYPRLITKAKACQEGAVGFWSVARPGLDRRDSVKFVCVGGKYTRQ